MDWTVYTTSLTFYNFLKAEEIHCLVYESKFEAIGFHKKKIGSKIPKIIKFFLGCCGTFIIFLIILIPMILFSNLNPTAIPNLIKSSGSRLNIVLNGTNTFNIARNSKLLELQVVNDQQFNALYSNQTLFGDVRRKNFEVNSILFLLFINFQYFNF